MTELTKVKGIGSRTLMLFNKMGISSVEELVTHYPYRYDFISRTNIKEANDGDKVIIDGKVDCLPVLLRLKGSLNKMNLRVVTTDKNIVGVSIFNRAFLKNSLTVGTNIIVIGKYEKTKNVITASEIRMGLIGNKEKIESVYHGTCGLSSKNIATFINTAIMEYGSIISDYIPKYLIEKYNFLNKKAALNIVHNPSTKENIKDASLRLKYEELFSFMTKINYLKLKNKKIKTGLDRHINKGLIDDFISKLPFELTIDQLKVIDEILDDLNSCGRMNRLLQGDVGSGKTIVSFIAMYANYLSGYQGALMVPTEILSVQHFNSIKSFFNGYDINIELLTGSTSKKEKTRIYEELETGKIDIVIGTHALIQEGVIYKNLGLVITDEQHRFGVLQRANLKNKGLIPDVLYMSATPIPRTYALTIYGDMDVSTISMMPKGRIPIETYLKKDDEIKEVLGMMNQELKDGHQIFVIAPLIEESDNSDLTNVVELKEKMQLAFGQKYNIGIIHGKMRQEQKDTIMNEFIENKVQILISTTVIEVGVDIANATMIVIFDADRFGLSTLHQLRGRVGRSNLKSTCVLISNSDAKRLDVMTKTNDGFVISEEDFKLRGHGDLFGTKQSGDMNFKIANIKQDYKILIQAKKDSMEFLQDNDPKYNELKSLIITDIKEG